MSVTTSEQSVAPGSPSDSTENDEPVWQAASAEAIFIGCCSYMSLPCQSPVAAVPANAAIATTAPKRSDQIHAPWSALSRPAIVGADPTMTLPSAPTVSMPSLRRCHRWYQLMPIRNMPATTSAPKIVWVNAASAVLLVSTAQMSFMTGLPSTSSTPTGCCIHEFATMMK